MPSNRNRAVIEVDIGQAADLNPNLLVFSRRKAMGSLAKGALYLDASLDELNKIRQMARHGDPEAERGVATGKYQYDRLIIKMDEISQRPKTFNPVKIITHYNESRAFESDSRKHYALVRRTSEAVRRSLLSVPSGDFTRVEASELSPTERVVGFVLKDDVNWGGQPEDNGTSTRDIFAGSFAQTTPQSGESAGSSVVQAKSSVSQPIAATTQGIPWGPTSAIRGDGAGTSTMLTSSSTQFYSTSSPARRESQDSFFSACESFSQECHEVSPSSVSSSSVTGTIETATVTHGGEQLLTYLANTFTNMTQGLMREFIAAVMESNPARVENVYIGCQISDSSGTFTNATLNNGATSCHGADVQVRA